MCLLHIRLTVGIQFFIKQEIIVDGKKVKLQIWDFGGEIRVPILRYQLYVWESHGCIFMYETTRLHFPNHITPAMYIVKERCGRDVPIMLVGNKIDLVNKRAISTEHGIEVAKRSGFTGFSEIFCQNRSQYRKHLPNHSKTNGKTYEKTGRTRQIYQY